MGASDAPSEVVHASDAVPDQISGSSIATWSFMSSQSSLISLQYGSASVTCRVPRSGALAMHPGPYYMKGNPDPGRITSNSVNGIPDDTCYNVEAWPLIGLLWIHRRLAPLRRGTLTAVQYARTPSHPVSVTETLDNHL